MSTGLWQFKPVEVRRAIKSVQSAGLEVAQVEVGRDGKITINVVRQPSAAARPVAKEAPEEASP